MGDYKFILPKENPTVPEWISKKFVDPGFSSEVQLFDLKSDPSETTNVAEQNPKIVTKMEKLILEIIEGE